MKKSYLLSIAAIAAIAALSSSALSAESLPKEAPKVEKKSSGKLSIVGEIRERFEMLDGMNKKAYGDTPSLKGEPDENLLVSRLNLGFVYKQSPDITWKAIGYYAHAFGYGFEKEDFKKVSGDEVYYTHPQQDLDFSHLNIEIRNLAGASGLSTKIGRMSNRYGDKRVLGPGAWGNAYGWLWDLAKLSYKFDDNFIDVFYGQTKDKNIDRLSLINKHVFEGAGIYGHFATNKNGAVEPFVIYKNGLYTEPGNGENTQTNYTYGFRAYDKDLHGFNYETTFAKADGTIKEKDYDAYAYVAKFGYTFKNVAWKPNVVIGQIFSSGDDGKDDVVNTFRTPFGGTDGGLYGRMDIMRWNNLVENVVELHLKPHNDMKIKISYHDFSKDKAEDTWAYYKVAGKTDSKELGQELDIQYTWQYNKDLEFQVIYAMFQAGEAVSEAVRRGDTDLNDNDAQRLFLQFNYKFQ